MWRGFPVLTPEQHAVVQIDPATGILLDVDGGYAKGQPHYEVFACRADALTFVTGRLADEPSTEWCVFDASGTAIAHTRRVLDARGIGWKSRIIDIPVTG